MTPEDEAILDAQEAKALAGPDPFQKFQMKRRGRAPLDRLQAARDADEREKHLGVYYHAQRMRYVAMLRIAGKRFFLGDFKEQTEAVLAYDNAKWFLQDFCSRRPRLNFSTPLVPLDRVLAIRSTLLADGYPNTFDHGMGFVPPVTRKPSRGQYELR